MIAVTRSDFPFKRFTPVQKIGEIFSTCHFFLRLLQFAQKEFIPFEYLFHGKANGIRVLEAAALRKVSQADSVLFQNGTLFWDKFSQYKFYERSFPFAVPADKPYAFSLVDRK